MIKIISIKNVASLVDFTNKESRFPNGNSIIHGMNGSGKSQLCSVLQRISKIRSSMSVSEQDTTRTKAEVAAFLISRKSKEAVTNEIQVEIDDYSLKLNADTGEMAQSGNLPNMYVFNEAYVNENVGEKVELPEKEIRIGERNKERDNLLIEIKNAEKTEETLNTNITDLVESAKEDSGYRNQSRTNRIISAENYLMEINPGEENAEAKHKLDNLAIPPEPIETHLSIQFPNFEVEAELKEKLEIIFAKPFIEPKLTAEFYSNHLNLNKAFYEKGVALFREEKSTCPFCLTPKKADDPYIAELIAYIDSEFNDSVKTLNEFILFLKNYKTSIDGFVTRWNTQISTINEKSNALLLSKSISELSFAVSSFDDHMRILLRKIDNMTLVQDDLDVPDPIYTYFESDVRQLKVQHQSHLSLIDEINAAIDKISTTKRTLGEKIIKHHMYTLWNKNGMRDRLKQVKQELKENRERFEELASSISNDRTVDFFNQIIQILGIRKYELNDESSIVLRLDEDHDISEEGFRISSGERKYIALSYFFAEVLAAVSNSTELKTISVIIDDPVDSSDYNKFYSFVSVIENFDRILKTIYNNASISLGQFIIFTHNALLYERLVNSQSMENFIIQTVNNRTILEKPRRKIALTTFSSYIKKVTNYIKGMERSNNKDIGNYIRRILEIIASIENIESNKIQNLNASSKLNALSNHLSHGSLERLLDPLPETHEYIAACIELIEEIRDRIPALYEKIRVRYLNEIEIDEYRAKYQRLFQSA